MTAPLMTAFIAALKPFDSAALSEPLNLDVQRALAQDPLLKKLLFVDGRLDINVWRALLWASQRMGAVGTPWHQMAAHLRRVRHLRSDWTEPCCKAV